MCFLQGLDNLVHLKDLSLVHNQIERISNLDALTNLDVLALAHNKIADLGDVKALRKLSSLQCVTLKGKGRTIFGTGTYSLPGTPEPF